MALSENAKTPQGDTLSLEQKKELYRNNRYSMKVPPVSSNNWTAEDYIRWIDSNGTWWNNTTRKGK